MEKAEKRDRQGEDEDGEKKLQCNRFCVQCDMPLDDNERSNECCAECCAKAKKFCGSHGTSLEREVLLVGEQDVYVKQKLRCVPCVMETRGTPACRRCGQDILWCDEPGCRNIPCRSSEHHRGALPCHNSSSVWDSWGNVWTGGSYVFPSKKCGYCDQPIPCVAGRVHTERQSIGDEPAYAGCNIPCASPYCITCCTGCSKDYDEILMAKEVTRYNRSIHAIWCLKQKNLPRDLIQCIVVNSRGPYDVDEQCCQKCLRAENRNESDDERCIPHPFWRERESQP